MPDRTPLPHAPALDGLRGLAITLVMAFHAYPRLVPNGWLGVDAFFVLSAYLITRLSVIEFKRNACVDLRCFYLRRSLRILPALLTMLLCYTVYQLYWSHDRSHESLAVVLAGSYLMNWARAFHWGYQGALGHAWSLAMEEQFYLLWPLVLALSGFRTRRRWLLGLLLAGMCWRLILATSGADSERIYNGVDTHADGLLLGCCLGMTGWNPRLERAAKQWVAVPLALLGLAALLPQSKGVIAQTLSFPAVSLAAAWLILAARQPGLFARLLCLSPLRFTGRISYGLYLWHYPVLIIGSKLVPPGHASGLALMMLAYDVATLSFVYLEQPFLAMKERWAAPSVPVMHPSWLSASTARFDLGQSSAS